jgi:hypothetical protein
MATVWISAKMEAAKEPFKKHMAENFTSHNLLPAT